MPSPDEWMGDESPEHFKRLKEEQELPKDDGPKTPFPPELLEAILSQESPDEGPPEEDDPMEPWMEDRMEGHVGVKGPRADPYNLKRAFAPQVFIDAWSVLKENKGYRMPMTEEESYGDVSFRNHPLLGQPGYRPSRLEAPTSLGNEDEPIEPTFDEGYSGALQERTPPPMSRDTPSNPFQSNTGPASPEDLRRKQMLLEMIKNMGL